MTLQFSWYNAFWYFAVYGLVSWLVMRFMPPETRKKVLTYAPTKSRWEKISLTASRILRVLSYILAILSPVNIHALSFYMGTIVYIMGLILSTAALWQFSKVDVEKPITNGLYRYSRHPMQVMFYLLCLGVLLASANLYLTLCTIGYLVTFYPSFALQESYCLEQYGDVYAAYQKQTPRLLLINKEPKGELL